MNINFYFEVFYADIDKNDIAQGGSVPVINRYKIYIRDSSLKNTQVVEFYIDVSNQLSKFYTMKVK